MSKPEAKIHHTYSFNDFTIDLDRGCLLRAGQEVKLRPKVFDALRYLIENNNRLITKAELIQAVWSDSFVTDDSLVQCMVELRRALGDDGQALIKTMPRRGYIFAVEVQEINPAIEGVIYAEQTEAVRVVIEEEETQGSAQQVWPHVTVAEEKEGVNAEAESRRALQSEALAAADVKRRRRRLKVRSALVTVLVALAASTGALLYSRKAGPRKNATAPVRVIAVLPFKPIDADQRDETLELGMADALIAKLSTLRQVIVRPTTSVRKYAGLEQDPIAAGRDLRVESVLEGSTQRVGDRIRISARLLNVEDGRTLWAERFDERLTDIFALQDSISERVAASLAVQLTGAERELMTKRFTNNAEAYQLYLKGRYYLSKYTEEGAKKGLESFKQALDLDPNYALAYVGLSDAYYLLSNLYLPPSEAMPKARAAAMRALEIDEAVGEAHAALAIVKSQYYWEWVAAEREYKRALELNPGYAPTRHMYGIYLVEMGRPDEALDELKRAQELDPLSPSIAVTALWPFYFAPPGARQYDRAIAELQKIVALEPDFAMAHSFLGMIYAQKGMFAEAIAERHKAGQLDENDAGNLARLGYVYGLAGQRDEARRVLTELQERARRQHVSAFSLALVHTGLGEKDQALAWLEKAYQVRDEDLVLLNVYPELDSLQSDSRFTDLLRRMNLAP